MTRALLLVLVLLGAGLALWTLARSGGREGVASSAEHAPPVETDTTYALAAPRGEQREPELAPAPARTAEALPAPARESIHRAGELVVEVVDEEGRVIPNVPVLVLRHPRAAPDNPFERQVIARETTEFDGRAVFDAAEVASERRPDSVIEATIGPGLPRAPRRELSEDDGGIVRLVVARSLAGEHGVTRVRVIDSAGAPQGRVLVAWESRTEERIRGGAHFGGSHLGSAVSDPSTGIAELSWLAPRSPWKPAAKGAIRRYRARASVMFDEEATVLDLGPTLPLDEVPTLTLAPFGALEVRVEDEQGRPVSSGSVKVALSDRETWYEAPIHERRARFDTIGLGHELGVAMWTADGRGTRIEIAGPRHAGETVQAVLRLAPFGPDAYFTAVDEFGAPLADILIEIDTLHIERDLHYFPELRTDGDGRASVRVPRDGFRDGHSYLDLTADASRNAALFGDLWAAVPLGPATEASTLDLGTIVFQGPPPSDREPLVSGRVLDERGAPLAGAEVQVEPYETDDEWRATARSASDGSFEVAGPAADPLQLRVSAEGHLPRKLDDLARGTRDCVVRLSRAVRFEARLALAPDAPADLVELGLDGPEQRTFLGEAHVELRDLAPGEYDLVVRTVQGRWLVQRVEGLPLAHDAAIDPRLDPLDLRGALRACRFRLDSAGFGPLFDATVLVRVECLGEGPARTDEEGRLVLLLPSDAAWVEVHPPGHAPIRANPSVDERVLTFEPE